MASITPTIPVLPTIPLFRLIGSPLPQTTRVETFGIVGVDGVGVHLLGLFGEQSDWTAMQFGTVAALNTLYLSITTAQGAVCTFINDEGQTFINQLIQGVSQPQKRTAIDFAGSEEMYTIAISTRTV